MSEYYKKSSFIKKMSQLAKQERLTREKKALVGGQNKLDADKDGDIDAKDLANLRDKKKTIKEGDEIQSSDYKISPSGRKVRAKHIIFHSQDDDENQKEQTEKEQKEKMKKEEYALEEKTLSASEMKKREEIVKSMKKKVQGFKDRYGDRAQEVMYATATKLAKEEFTTEATSYSDREVRPAPKTDIKVGDRVVADLRKEKNYPNKQQYSSGIVSRVGEKGVHIKPDRGGEAEWHPHKIVKKLGTKTVAESHTAQTKKSVKDFTNIKEGIEMLKAKEPPFEGGVPAKGTVKDKSGAVHSPMSRARDLARQAMKKQVKEGYDLIINDEQADDLIAESYLDSVEQIHELSKSTLGAYVKKAKGSAIGSAQVMGMGNKMTGQKTQDKAEKTVQKRGAGINKAVDRLTREEVDLDESKMAQLDSDLKDLSHADKPGVTEGKYQPLWTVEQHTAGHHNAFYIVKGHSKPREVWKNARGMSDFKSRSAAEAKATELNSQDLDESKMAQLDSDLKDLSHADFHKEYGKPKHHYDPSNFKKPVQSGKEMDRVKSLAQRAMASMKKEEVEYEQMDEEMISYSDFHAKIAAHRKAGNDIADSKYDDKKAHYTVVDKEGTARKVTHTEKGSKMENLGKHKGEVEDDEGKKVQKTVNEPAEKRGRGRPSGQTGLSYKPRDPASKAASAAKAAASKAANRTKTTK